MGSSPEKALDLVSLTLLSSSQGSVTQSLREQTGAPWAKTAKLSNQSLSQAVIIEFSSLHLKSDTVLLWICESGHNGRNCHVERVSVFWVVWVMLSRGDSCVFLAWTLSFFREVVR